MLLVWQFPTKGIHTLGIQLSDPTANYFHKMKTSSQNLHFNDSIHNLPKLETTKWTNCPMKKITLDMKQT